MGNRKYSGGQPKTYRLIQMSFLAQTTWKTHRVEGLWRDIMLLVFKLAALVELILVVLEFSGFVRLRGLPLGGGQIQQIGIVFATAYVVAEFIDLLKGARGQPRPWP